MSTVGDVSDIDNRFWLVYGELVRQPLGTAAEIAVRTGFARPAVEAALHSLAQHGMAAADRRGVVTVWGARPPESAEALAAQERHVGLLRERFRTLSGGQVFAGVEGRGYPGIEILHSRDALRDRILGEVAAAQRELLWFDHPPRVFAAQDDEPHSLLRTRRKRIAMGVRCRTLYQDGHLGHPEHGAQTPGAAGAEARGVDRLPLRMLICDRRVAVVPLDRAEDEQGATLVLHASGLLTALVSVFEILWDSAVPAPSDPGRDELNAAERETLALLSAGLPDEAIARELGVSRRTVVRRSSVLMQRLGASSRFQAGVQAARRGWV